MKFQVDHDYHVHTQLSPCSSDPAMTPETIMEFGLSHGMKDIVLTDHFWDETIPGTTFWPGYAVISQWLPLPQSPELRMHLGCEAELDITATVGISRKTAEKFDFIAVPTNHIHLVHSTVREEDVHNIKALTRLYVERWKALLAADLPFHKMGIAHLDGICLNGFTDQGTIRLEILEGISDDVYKDLFSRTAKLGMGVELNVPVNCYTNEQLDRALRIYRIAAECDCRFYCGTDAHHPKHLEPYYQDCCLVVDKLGLDEEQKFNPFARNL
ncbi:MAG: hypothetical protein E7658_01325 [Ruminococcaceae bacterium]|nr:hypothetical protein [Oscillospiraceae bacterium]